VRVTVDHTGMLTELDLDPEALRQRQNTELARLIIDTVRQATANARDHVRDTYQGLVDEGAIRALPRNLLAPPDATPTTPPTAPPNPTTTNHTAGSTTSTDRHTDAGSR
jgi:hypothetical protein